MSELLTLKELRKLCKEANVSSSGRKSLLIHRLNNPKDNQKGSLCSKNGGEYEKQIQIITSGVKHIYSSIPFNAQENSQLGGSSAGNDIECNFRSEKDIPIEIKIHTTPDWMQSKIYYDTQEKIWKASDKGKIPPHCKEVFTQIIGDNNKCIFGGLVPELKNITHTEWQNNKANFKDEYLDCPDDTISRLYNLKGCYYIQISDKGLYHLGTDPCDFGVPYFSCAQKLRIRVKVHSRKNAKGNASLSVMASCIPQNIKNLIPSPYSLDNTSKLPSQLVSL